MNRNTSIFLAVTLLAAAFAWLSPGRAVQPGRLPEVHAALRDDCLACHVLGRGVTREKCVACHEVAGIGLRNAAGRALAEPRPAVQGLHQRGGRSACALCHAEHAGRLGPGAAARFTHDNLPRDLAHDCAACHEGQQPADTLHLSVRLSCADCHGLEAWKPATFDHEVLVGARDCRACHRQDRPSDELHRGLAGGDCGSCHGTRDWKPASFDHARWFRLGGVHPARCADCHQPGLGYKHYTCTGCHAHSPARLAAEHREEGIRDIRDCMRCHRGGEDEGGEGGHEHGRGHGAGEGEEDD